MSDDTPKRRRGRPRTFDRQRAVAVAMENYWREGVHTLSLSEVCRRAKLSKPALYREFGGEDALMDAALEHYSERVVSPVLAALSLDLSFPDLAEQLILGMTADSGTPAGCLFTEMRLARSRLGPVTQARIQAMELRRLSAFEVWFEQALVKHEVEPSIPVDLAAHYIDTQLATILTQMSAGEEPERVRSLARMAFHVLYSSGRPRPSNV
jgi:AcrR family transcriptional regulator